MPLSPGWRWVQPFPLPYQLSLVRPLQGWFRLGCACPSPLCVPTVVHGCLEELSACSILQSLASGHAAGGNVHLDITWITRLVGSLIRGSVRYRPRWSLRPGTVASCLHGWLIDRGWRLVREWVWEHDFAAVALDLFSPRVLPSLLPGLAGVAQHNLRQGWRAWCFQKWANSGRHEVQQLEEATSAIFRNLNFQDIRDWALSNGTASSIALGATCSPANFQVRDPTKSICPWPDCDELGTWNHICWTCSKRPSTMTRPHDWLARFGWSLFTDQTDTVAQVRAWLHTCQTKVWELRRNS